MTNLLSKGRLLFLCRGVRLFNVGILVNYKYTPLVALKPYVISLTRLPFLPQHRSPAEYGTGN